METLRSKQADRITVLHIVAPAEVGGLERVVWALADGHERMGHSVHVAAVMSPRYGNGDHPFLASVRDTGAAVHAWRVPDRGYWRERVLVREFCRAERPDVVHTHGYRPDVVDAGVARRLGIPVVTTVHGFIGSTRRSRLYERVQRLVFRRFDRVVAVSQPLAKKLARDGVPADRIEVVPNAWSAAGPALDRDTARLELDIPLDGFRIGFVGRLAQEKGFDVLVDALARLVEHASPAGPPIGVSVAGQGRDRLALEAQARSLGVADRITWHGAVPDAARLFTAFDVFVLSSRTEGTPIVLFEAMAAGVPIVATRVGGVPDVLSPAEAWLVPADDPAALAAAIGEVRDNPAEAARRACAARERLATAYSVEPWLACYESLYRSIMRAATTPVAAL